MNGLCGCGKVAYKDLPCSYPNILLKPTMKAPDFEAEAYYQGKKINVRLGEFNNRWVVLFFYASDFTFV